MLLEMDLVNSPKIKQRISYNFMEFFYIPPACLGLLWRLWDEVSAGESQVVEKVVGIVVLREQYRIVFRYMMIVSYRPKYLC